MRKMTGIPAVHPPGAAGSDFSLSSWSAFSLSSSLTNSFRSWVSVDRSNDALSSMRPIPALFMTGGRRIPSAANGSWQRCTGNWPLGPCELGPCELGSSSNAFQSFAVYTEVSVSVNADRAENSENELTLGVMPLKVAPNATSPLTGTSTDDGERNDRVDRCKVERCDCDPGVVIIIVGMTGDDVGKTGEEAADDIGLMGSMATDDGVPVGEVVQDGPPALGANGIGPGFIGPIGMVWTAGCLVYCGIDGDRWSNTV